MNNLKDRPTDSVSLPSNTAAVTASNLRPVFFVSLIALLACFSVPLYRLVRFALQSDLYSYVLLVPFVSLYLFRIDSKGSLRLSAQNRTCAAVLVTLGVIVLGGYWAAVMSGAKLPQQDALAYPTLSLVLLCAGICSWFLDRSTVKAAAFPLFFLLFMIPFPLAMELAIEEFLQRGSAPPAFWFLKLAGTPVFRQDMVFQLPGITLQIAPECSGIRSSIVLFMTSLVAGHLFLRSAWKRALLTFAVLPLALLRNGFRVFVIGQLCVNIGPHMVDSPIHHHGGPIFFILSLIPFALFTYYLVKSDRSHNRSKVQTRES